MSRITIFMALIFVGSIIAIGCAGSDPVTGDLGTELTQRSVNTTQTQLWGIWDVTIDPETGAVDVSQSRHAEMAVNVSMFLGTQYISFSIGNMETYPDHMDIAVDVSLRHPFPGYEKYNGFDVRGVVMGDGSLWDSWDPDANLMHPDPLNDVYLSNDDGYTRWFNATEFTSGNLFGFTDPAFSTPPGYRGNAKLNAYKYFADGLAEDEDSYAFLMANPADRGVFTAGSQNTREYLLRFPTPDPGLKFTYAVLACWEFPGTENPTLDDFPPGANSTEAVSVSVNITEDLFYIGPGDFGGDLILAIDAWDWSFSAGGTENITLTIASDVLNDPYVATPTDLVFTDENMAGWQVSIPADNIESNDPVEAWAILTYADFDYNCDLSGYNPTDPLASYFRIRGIPVGTGGPCTAPDPVGDLDLTTGRTDPDVLDPVTEVIISWDDITDEAEYAIYVDTDPWNGLTDNLELLGTAAADATKYTHDSTSDIPLSGNASYVYVVRGRGEIGNENCESDDSEIAFIELENFEGGSSSDGGEWTHVTQMGDTLLQEGGNNPINGDTSLEEIIPFEIGENSPDDNIWLVVVSPELPDIPDVENANFELNHHSSGIPGSYCTRNIGTLSEMPEPNPSDHKLYDFESLWYDGYGFVYNYRTDNNGWAHGWNYVWGEDFPVDMNINIEWFITYADVLHAFSGYSFMDTYMGGTGYPDGRRFVTVGVSLGWLTFPVDTYRVDDIAVILD